MTCFCHKTALMDCYSCAFTLVVITEISHQPMFVRNPSLFLLVLFTAMCNGAVLSEPVTVDVFNQQREQSRHTYIAIAQANYADAHKAALHLQQRIKQLLAKPSTENLESARRAWIDARAIYQQTEAFRFGNPVVDEWDPGVNAWPLDEGLIDYIATDSFVNVENAFFNANIIANPVLKVGGQTINARRITPAFLKETLHELGGIEANVALGWHAIEFLLWGQDLNGTKGGAGNRPASDFDNRNCSHNNCKRRADYLRSAMQVLVDDLKWMVEQWQPSGQAVRQLRSQPINRAIVAMFQGIGSLAYGELAGERMKLGLLIHDPEEEHDCFSDNTHNSHYYNVKGIQNVYTGNYLRASGDLIDSPGLSDLVALIDPVTNTRVLDALAIAEQKAAAIVNRAETIEAYDQMLAAGNTAGNQVIEEAIQALIALSAELERAVAVIQPERIEFQGSDSL